MDTDLPDIATQIPVLDKKTSNVTRDSVVRAVRESAANNSHLVGTLQISPQFCFTFLVALQFFHCCSLWWWLLFRLEKCKQPLEVFSFHKTEWEQISCHHCHYFITTVCANRASKWSDDTACRPSPLVSSLSVICKFNVTDLSLHVILVLFF